MGIIVTMAVICFLFIVAIMINSSCKRSLTTIIILHTHSSLQHRRMSTTTRSYSNHSLLFHLQGDNSTTLSFSILDNNDSNLDNVYSALVITEKNTGKVVGQIPYSFYEFSYITFRYPFSKCWHPCSDIEI
jgi:hypothetical protein